MLRQRGLSKPRYDSDLLYNSSKSPLPLQDCGGEVLSPNAMLDVAILEVVLVVDLQHLRFATR